MSHTRIDGYKLERLDAHHLKTHIPRDLISSYRLEMLLSLPRVNLDAGNMMPEMDAGYPFVDLH